MKITDLKIKIIDDESPVIAYCSIVFDNQFKIEKIRLLDNNGRFIVAMPSIKSRDNVYKDVAYPITQEMRKKIEITILNSYYGQIKSSEMYTGEFDEPRPNKEITGK